MKRKYLVFILCTIVCLLPFVLFGQDTASQSTSFFKGDGAFEKWFMDAFTQLDTDMGDRALEMSRLGRAIGALGALMYLGYIGWQMQEGQASWSVTPMLRPIIIGFILVNWEGFTNMIKYPLENLAVPSMEIFKDIEKDADDLRVKRYKYQNYILDQTIKVKAENDAKVKEMERAEHNILEKAGDWVEDQGSEIWQSIIEYQERTAYKLQQIITNAMDWIALVILRVCVYLIFTIQKIWSYILIILGPIAVGIALIPGFESSFYNWLAKFININLYTFVAYTSINIGQQIIMSGYKMEIDRYSKIVDESGNLLDPALLLQYTAWGGSLSLMAFTAVGYLVTAVAVLMTPTIADSIVSAGGAGIMTKAKQASSNLANASGKGLKGAKSLGGTTRKIAGSTAGLIKSGVEKGAAALSRPIADNMFKK
ncbi:type IV secretion system protein [Ornithobacterium rhinotracheale]